MLARQSLPQTRERLPYTKLTFCPAVRSCAHFLQALAPTRARADEGTPYAHAASQVRTHERDRISVAPHRNTFEIMRLFATYHSAHSRFTLRDTTASTMTAWNGGNIQSHAAAQITSDRACW